MEIIPAILELNKENFKLKLDEFAKTANRIQVDFNDGSFEDTKTVSVVEISELVKEYRDKIAFEAHLMVQKPMDFIPGLVEAGFKKIIVQYEIKANVREILERLVDLDVFVGLAIGPETSVFEIEPLVDLLDTITVMDIEPGKQGQKFLQAELEKIREIKTGGFLGEVQADGGINEDTFIEVAQTNPDTLVVGSSYERLRDQS